MTLPRPLALEIAADRIYERSTETADGCRLWDGPVNGSGYATIRVPGYSTTTAHRAIYEWGHGGPLPEGMHVDHRCHSDNVSACPDGQACQHRRCVQLAHLELVTLAENNRRGMKAQQMTCKRGHEFTAENTWTRHDGRRHCRACRPYQRGEASA